MKSKLFISGTGKDKRHILGFTLVEIFVVVAVSALIAGLALSYSRKGEDRISLYIESQKIIELIFRAKSLSLATYANAPGSDKPCGYGLQLDYSAQQYSLFSYVPVSAPEFCPSPSDVSSVPEISREPVDGARYAYKPASGVLLQAMGDSLYVVLFVPPAPRTLLSRNFGGGGFVDLPSFVYLTTRDGSATMKIVVSPEGQVNFQ